MVGYRLGNVRKAEDVLEVGNKFFGWEFPRYFFYLEKKFISNSKEKRVK